MTVRDLKKMLLSLDSACDDYEVVVGKAGVADVDGESNAFREDLPVSLVMLTLTPVDSEMELWLGHVEEEQREELLEIVESWGTFKTLQP